MFISKRKFGHLVVPVIVAMAFQMLPAGAFAGGPSSSKPSHRNTGKRTAQPTAKPTPKSPVTFSITSSMRQGQLIVSLDNVPIFNEGFRKPLLIISQTTEWNPVQVPAGRHRLTAKVNGANGKTYLSGIYDLDVSPTKGIDLRIRVKGDMLTVEPAS